MNAWILFLQTGHVPTITAGICLRIQHPTEMPPPGPLVPPSPPASHALPSILVPPWSMTMDPGGDPEGGEVS